MLHNLYLIVAVGLRVAGLLIAVFGISFGVFMLSFAASDPGYMLVAPMTAIFPSLLGITLWFLAKPIARVVTAQL